MKGKCYQGVGITVIGFGLCTTGGLYPVQANENSANNAGSPPSATQDQTGGVGDKPSGTRPSQETKPADNRTEQTTDGASDAGGEEKGTTDPKEWTLKVGADYYAGKSNLAGSRRFSDGFWAAGSGPAYPSTLYMRSQRGDGSEFKLSWGVGELYSGFNQTIDQPVEGWYKTPISKTNVTVGKFWIPFALQEWEYETKWGVQLDRQVGQYGFLGAAVYDRNTNTPNAYLRTNRTFGKNLNVGVSLGAGRGINYGSVQNRGLGLDATYTFGGWQFVTENVVFTRRQGERFRFNFAKLGYINLGKFKPFIATYNWNDQTGTFGSFRSNAIAASYQLRPEVAIEGGFADTPGRTVNWIQLHFTIER